MTTEEYRQRRLLIDNKYKEMQTQGSSKDKPYIWSWYQYNRNALEREYWASKGTQHE